MGGQPARVRFTSVIGITGLLVALSKHENAIPTTNWHASWTLVIRDTTLLTLSLSVDPSWVGDPFRWVPPLAGLPLGVLGSRQPAHLQSHYAA